MSNEIEENINLATNDSTSTPQVDVSVIEGNARSEAVSSKPQKHKEPSKTSLLVWDHFAKFVDDKGNHKASCSHYDKVLCADTKKIEHLL
ncbi:Uncharacterized protein TCM_001680 [Theobroma cacao]|uniref:Uncharacterized protein n=1 Tax=Theobroma cacao TaxID=3641 RepID=A0A061DJN4_THECC|nr:Uncharacterized protein TCM_001680 [Theobroma cacao]